jgi:hypothetical protein
MNYWNDSSGDGLRGLLRTDIITYLVELLMKQYQMSMAASIESRVPFLDHELAEFTTSIPAKYETKGFTGKFILKSAAEDFARYRVPAEDGFPDAVGLLVGRGRSWITSSGFCWSHGPWIGNISKPTWSTDCLPNTATDTVITGIAGGDFSTWNWERFCLEASRSRRCISRRE